MRGLRRCSVVVGSTFHSGCQRSRLALPGSLKNRPREEHVSAFWRCRDGSSEIQGTPELREQGTAPSLAAPVLWRFLCLEVSSGNERWQSDVVIGPTGAAAIKHPITTVSRVPWTLQATLTHRLICSPKRHAGGIIRSPRCSAEPAQWQSRRTAPAGTCQAPEQ